MLYEVVWEAASMVKCPNESFHTLYDEWLSAKPGSYKGVTRPFIGNLGSGSDFTAFLQLHGISSVSMSYVSWPLLVCLCKWSRHILSVCLL